MEWSRLLQSCISGSLRNALRTLLKPYEMRLCIKRLPACTGPATVISETPGLSEPAS